jgi:salicylate hydroxylase
VYKWALFDRAPIDRWSRGAVTLLGDAAHPMLPFMAQGGSQSIEDAWVLADCLSASSDELTGLATYEQRRRERTAALQRVSREMGRNVQLSDPEAVRERNEGMRAAGAGYASRYDWIFGFTP